ncbi:hypothetical protein BP422_15430 [Brevibacillus formosus]|uniref:Uncharacterized protein n=1 Tax=Brevibacillus formosus TaxID=54913 RepID=A0A220MIC0_9BACL|nr:hypothetical protein BP422_15430 [Brevibacillus formosus]
MVTNNRYKVANTPLCSKDPLFGAESAPLDIPAIWITIDEYCHAVPKMQKEATDNFKRKMKQSLSV